ncbi:efflux transporter outer membrane subunit [Diaphorobacter sp. HDW4B]|uniref:efflux transporter outer membrane subunit n=1 Tax=Diaphorobacter sp. HDW4B TaxID=2714925 RepID=UPI00140C03E7|nr:efflux transporter outer membrane subunit [Diaphorobacter sp. HDW4B]QIL69495.1 efflux transporter outer membrane subunit [Diaphorobacter sp. HDW4B]
MSHTNFPSPFFRPAPVHRLGVLGLALLIAGCSSFGVDRSLPGESAQVSVPQNWSGTAASQNAGAGAGAGADADAQLVSWWQQFGDAQMTALIEQALAANPGLRGAQQAVAQARAQADQTRAGLLPNVNGSGSAQRSRQGNNGSSNYVSTGLDASWEIDLFGKLQSGVTASEADLAATRAALEGARVSLSAEVALAYVDLRSGQQRLLIAENNLKSQQETLQITEWRRQAGLTTSLVVEQSRTQVQQTAAQIPQLTSSIAQSRHSLAVLTGKTPEALDQQLAETQKLPQAPQQLSLRFPADTLRQRPDVWQAGEQVKAALARVDQAQAARYPSLKLSGSLGLGAATIGALSGGSAVAASILGGLSVPVFDGGALRAQVEAQIAALEQSRSSYQTTVLTALQEVEDALATVRGDRAKLAELRIAAESAGNANLLAQQQYTSGLVDFQTVLETQRSLLSAQDSVVSTEASLLQDHVRLYKALGGGWSPESHPVSGNADNHNASKISQAGKQ